MQVEHGSNGTLDKFNVLVNGRYTSSVQPTLVGDCSTACYV